jgi:hypothetical protein
MSIGALAGIALAVAIGIVAGGGLLAWAMLRLIGRRRTQRMVAARWPEADPDDEGHGRHHLRDAENDGPGELASPVRPYIRRRQA